MFVTRKRRRKVRHRPDPRVRVIPSDEIESRIARELEKAQAILAAPSPQTLFDSPYLVSAAYYHDGLLDNYDEAKRDADPAGRIVTAIIRRAPPDWKRSYLCAVAELAAQCSSELAPFRFVLPIPYDTPSGRRRRAVHPFAIDLFTAEGTSVRSATRGLVLLAESGWVAGEWFSTSSVRGGNTVIVYDPDRSRFLRYAHLERAGVRPGDWVEAGDSLGEVGHSGFNANRRGHGRHLHFEINEYDGRTVSAVSHQDLKAIIEAVTATCPGFAPSANPQNAPE